MNSVSDVLLALGVLYFLPVFYFCFSFAEYFCAKAKFINCQCEEKYPHRYKKFFDFFRKDKK